MQAEFALQNSHNNWTCFHEQPPHVEAHYEFGWKQQESRGRACRYSRLIIKLLQSADQEEKTVYFKKMQILFLKTVAVVQERERYNGSKLCGNRTLSEVLKLESHKRCCCGHFMCICSSAHFLVASTPPLFLW